MNAQPAINPETGGPAYGLIIAGGSGTRLWPISRTNNPKQLLPLGGGDLSLLQETFRRLSRSIDPGRILTVTNAGYDAQVLQQLRMLYPDLPPEHVLSEPMGKDSGPAVLWGALHIHDEAPDAVVAVVWSDQHMTREAVFDQALALAMAHARKGDLVALGVTPTRPETGLGYIKGGEALEEGVFHVERFTEKPDLATAERFVADGGYTWNAGIFVFNVRTLLDEFERLAPHLHDAFAKHAKQRNNVGWNDPELMHAVYEEVPADSIDYLLLEKTNRLRVIPCDLDWSDLGAWDVLYQKAPKDADGNALSGNVMAVSTRNSFVRGHKRLITTIGVENLVVVDTDDAVLICDMSKVQDVKELVQALHNTGRPEAATGAVTVRPWGSFTDIREGAQYKIKLIEVLPGHKLSLQKHDKRAEHWVVVDGEGHVTVGDRLLHLKANESCHIPQGERHRVENRGEKPLHLIEVQYGSYLGEDDIVRFADDYGRS